MKSAQTKVHEDPKGAAKAGPHGTVLAVQISPGGIPKKPVEEAVVGRMGIEGDGRDHGKHWKEERAISIQDLELIEQIRDDGYDVAPGVMGENLTVKDLHVQTLLPGTKLHFSGGLVLELTGPRKPCFVLDTIDEKLKDDVINRIGCMARVVQENTIRPGETVWAE